jgi:hypothetical protein
MNNKAPETDEQFKERKRLGERAHDRLDKGEEAHASQIQAFALAAMRAPALAAAGGIAAAIGFFSANYEALKQLPQGIQLFNEITSWFFIAVIFAVITPASAYFSQLAYQDCIQRMERIWEHPYVVPTKWSSRVKYLGNFFRWLTVMLNMCAIGAIIKGGLKFLLLVSLM